MDNQPFWKTKSLTEMSTAEWESLCDGCAKCCLHKLEDEDTGEVYYTDIVCRNLDAGTCQCRHYSDRATRVAGCVVLQPEDVDAFYWLPQTCAYRLVSEGKPLPQWHHLVSCSAQSVHTSGNSIVGRTVSELDVCPDDYEDHIVRWVD